MRPRISAQRGFSLVETLFAAALLVVVGASVYGGFVLIAKGVTVAKVRNGALALANERLEIVRGMDYTDIGVVGGLPAGKIKQTETVKRGLDYQITTTVRSIDLPFDGLIGGSPNDTAPADQKLVEVAVSCATCKEITRVSTRVSPEGLELASGNGAIFVQVVDAAGLPVSDASVTIKSTKAAVPVTVIDRTGVDGFLRLVDVATGTAAWSVAVAKDGYSSARTYPPGGATNPVPTLPDLNVTKGAVTQVTLGIDRLSTVEGVAVKTTCETVSGFDFNLFGQKLIGLDTYKYDAPQATAGDGLFGPVTVEWDQYSAEPADSAWTLAGTNPPQPFAVAPAAAAFVQMVVAPKVPLGFLVRVLDVGTDLPIAGAAVTLSRTGWSSLKTTGYGSATQTTWTGGPSAQNAGDTPSAFWASSGSVDYTGAAGGTLALKKTGSNFALSGWVESSTFDTGTTTKLVSLSWLPGDQPSRAGANTVRFQLAALAEATATSTWSYVGPDGTAATYFTAPGQAVPNSFSEKRYFRYKVFLATASNKATPSVSDVSVTYTLGCAPAGQVFFSGLTSSTAYTVAVTATGYQAKTLTSQKVQADWQELTVKLSK